MQPHALAAVLLLALPLALASDASAQRRIRFMEMDRNGDGQIARDEWRGSLRSFTVHDWNGDGVLSGDEVRVGARRPQQQEPDYPSEPLIMRDWTAANFQNLDHNGDGRLTRNEWHYDMEAFHRADRNRDNILSRAEFVGEGIEDDRDDLFVDLDLNGDGRVSRNEWHGTRQEFTALDRNRDGSLTWAEVVGTTAAPDDTFASLDVDRSGHIDRHEWHWSRASFDRRDADRDGVLSRHEFGAATGEQPVGTAGRMVVVNAQDRWTDTGINVRAGDLITFDAQGTVVLSTNGTDVADPTGARSGRRAANAPVNSTPAGGLIAMISGSAPVYVGDRATRLRAPASGRLYLGVNDDHLLDNSGEFRVSIVVQR